MRKPNSSTFLGIVLGLIAGMIIAIIMAIIIPKMSTPFVNNIENDKKSNISGMYATKMAERSLIYDKFLNLNQSLYSNKNVAVEEKSILSSDVDIPAEIRDTKNKQTISDHRRIYFLQIGAFRPTEATGFCPTLLCRCYAALMVTC